MIKTIIVLVTICIVAFPVSAMDYTAPEAPAPAKQLMPVESSSFYEDLCYIIREAVSKLNPSLAEATRVCVSVLAVTLLVSILQTFSSITTTAVSLTATIAVSCILLSPTQALINIGIDTVSQLSDYGKLLAPVLTGALAATGATTSSATLYAVTIAFDTILTIAMTNLIIPLLYAYIALGIAKSSIKQPILNNLHSFIKWLVTWMLKISIYLFTGFLGITSVVSGSVDAVAIKATKLTISGTVPVIGGIISDASEAVLVSASLLKSAAGVYGFLAIIAIWIGPFIRLGMQYLALKITVGISGLFGSKSVTAVLETFTTTMGFLLAITGTISMLLLISTTCFIKGVT